ncbi:hypothetical protein IKO_05738 [Bacillus cereus VDM034]|nr:hypothetical protein IKO_05738 [Bacillus cereus VDM034]
MNYTSPTIKPVSSKGSADCACGLLIGNGNS